MGDVVSICSDNRIEFCLIPVAAFMAGLTVATINPEYTNAEFLHCLGLSNPKIVFCTPSSLPKVASALGSFRCIERIVVFGNHPPRDVDTIVSLERILQLRHLVALDPDEFTGPELNVDETTATILCSSGTTGLPKGVMASQGNMVSYISILKQLMNYNLNDPSEEIMLGLVPFFHSMGLMTMLLSLFGGRKLIVMRRFSVERLLKTIERFRINVIAVPPPVIVQLSRTPLLDKYDISCLKEVRCGAAALPRHYERLAVKKLNLKQVHQAYGMTETTLGVLFAPPNGSPLGSVGKLVPGMWAKVVDENGRSLPARSEGELCFRGPLIMQGYIGNRTATSATIDPDGWLHTGDVGYYDENGFFYVVDRIKELVKYKGYQVPPAELEALLVAHPDVVDAAVVGTPDDDAGELPTAFAVVRPGATVSPKELQDYIKGNASK